MPEVAKTLYGLRHQLWAVTRLWIEGMQSNEGLVKTRRVQLSIKMTRKYGILCTTRAIITVKIPLSALSNSPVMSLDLSKAASPDDKQEVKSLPLHHHHRPPPLPHYVSVSVPDPVLDPGQ